MIGILSIIIDICVELLRLKVSVKLISHVFVYTALSNNYLLKFNTSYIKQTINILISFATFDHNLIDTFGIHYAKYKDK